MALMQDVLIMARPEPDAVEFVRRPLPAMGREDAHLRILTAGICGTDLHIIKWNPWAAKAYSPPIALGHEFCAEVVDVGEGVSNIRKGDRVVAETHLACGHCRQCRMNRRHTCSNLRVFSRLDRGAFASQSIVPAQLLRRVPENITPLQAALFEPLGIAERAVRQASVTGRSLLVCGCGPIGLLAIAVAKKYGADFILASDPVPQRRDLAAQMGADATLDGSSDALGATMQRHNVEVAIDTSGHDAAIQTTLAHLEVGGHLVLAGLPEGPVALDLSRDVILREVKVSGIYGRLLDETWIATERLMSSANFNVTPLLSHRFPLAEFRDAFECAKSGRAGKVTFEIS
jgi:threonine 3-dehydrogenase